jgi:hypothetical protein
VPARGIEEKLTREGESTVVGGGEQGGGGSNGGNGEGLGFQRPTGLKGEGEGEGADGRRDASASAHQRARDAVARCPCCSTGG